MTLQQLLGTALPIIQAPIQHDSGPTIRTGDDT